MDLIETITCTYRVATSQSIPMVADIEYQSAYSERKIILAKGSGSIQTSYYCPNNTWIERTLQRKVIGKFEEN